MFTIVLTSQRVQFCNTSSSRANSPAPNGQTKDRVFYIKLFYFSSEYYNITNVYQILMKNKTFIYITFNGCPLRTGESGLRLMAKLKRFG